jgi:hypothetical protein
LARKTREVEYYRLWAGNAGDAGTWDTDFIAIPADTPEHRIEAAVQEAAASIKWRDAPPVLVGLYSAPQPEGDDSPCLSVLLSFVVEGWFEQEIEITDKRYVKKTCAQLAALFEQGKLATTVHDEGDRAITEVSTGKIIGRVQRTRDETTYDGFCLEDMHGQSKG